MFRTWKADVKRLLRPTGNVIHFYFESPIRKTEEAWENGSGTNFRVVGAP
jgi:hypothetical protein